MIHAHSYFAVTMRTMGICHRGVAAAILAFGFAIAVLANGILNSEPLLAGGFRLGISPRIDGVAH